MSLTVHSIVKNEPFIVYSIRSVYNYADTILLWDTGSDDPNMLLDLDRLISEDKDKKIKYKLIPACDAVKWTHKGRVHRKNEHLIDVGALRQLQLEETNTDLFMIVDGDEVHHRKGMETIMDDVIPNWPVGKVGCYIPVIWYTTMDKIFPVYDTAGRIQRTKEVFCRGRFPYERHCLISNGEKISGRGSMSFIASHVYPYAHFEQFLKPWRRTPENIMDSTYPLPEVMIDDPYFLNRYLELKTS